jgi:RNA 3'-terminal phosphate cyclase (ATP)
MGPAVHAVLERPGFYPAGGGRLRVAVTPAPRLGALALERRGAIRARRARAVVANLPRAIAERELATLAARLGWPPAAYAVEERHDSPGPGNVVLVEIDSEEVTEVFTGFGEKQVKAETVAAGAAAEALAYLAADDVPVGPHLADQLVLLLAIAGGGCFRTLAPTRHTHTQLEVVGRFLGPVVSAIDEGAGTWRFQGASS